MGVVVALGDVGIRGQMYVEEQEAVLCERISGGVTT